MSVESPGSTNFGEVVFETVREYACSPQIDPFDDSFRGLALTAPAHVELAVLPGDEDQPVEVDAARTRFAACIGLQLPLSRTANYPETESAISIVAIEAHTGRASCSTLTSGRPRAPLPPSEIPPEEQEERLDRFFYNVNLCDFLEIKTEPARYFVYATFDEFRSNVVEVEVA